MATPKWQAGHLYPTGSLVQPLTAIEPVITTLANAGFEDGNTTGWDFENVGGVASGSVITYGPHSGTYNFAYTGAAGGGSGGGIELIARKTEQPGANPGLIIRASMYFRLSQSGLSAGRVMIFWYDINGDEIVASRGVGNLVQKPGSQSERWVASNVTSVAPPGTVSVRVGFWILGRGDGDTRADTLTWDYTAATAPAGLIYEAVQPAIGTSDDEEPVWPLTLGVQVIDNTVIWEAVLANRVVWQASPILLSGPTEPAWPETVGERITDNTISWETVARRITDEKCPNSKVVAIMASKVFAVDKDITRYCATTNPTDWHTPDDAGFLGTGLQQANANDMAVLAPYRANLCALNASSFQYWLVDPDPALMRMLDQKEGIGSTWHHAAHPVEDDLYYLSQLGFRSIGVAAGTNSLASGDAGIVIDPLVRPAIAAAVASGISPVSTFYPSQGQFWGAFPGYPTADVTTVFVHTKNGGKGKWSRYVFPFAIEAFAQLGNDLYIRNGDQVSRVDEALIDDELEDESTVEFPGIVWWPYLDFGTKGVTSMLEGIDLVASGNPSVSIGYDQRNLALFTPAYAIPADTLPGDIIPFPVSAPTYSVRLDFAPGAKWSVQAVGLTFV